MKLFKTIIFLNLFLVCFSVESITVYGHRGARGLAPENTLSGFQVALEHHVDYVDIDVVMTKDGVLVAYHGLYLSPDVTRNAAGDWVDSNKKIIVKALTLEQLQTYDVGRIQPGTTYAKTYTSQEPEDHTMIPTLQAVIQDIKKTANYPVGFQIEIKTDPSQPDLSMPAEQMVIALNRIIQAEGIANRTKVQAYDWHCLLLLQKINPEIETAYLSDIDHEKVLKHRDSMIAGQWTAGYLLNNYHNSIPEMVKALGGTWWDVEETGITAAQLAQAHQLGLKVAVWPYPERTGKEIDVSLIERLIAMSVDGIITDRPDIVMSLLHG